MGKRNTVKKKKSKNPCNSCREILPFKKKKMANKNRDSTQKKKGLFGNSGDRVGEIYDEVRRINPTCGSFLFLSLSYFLSLHHHFHHLRTYLSFTLLLLLYFTLLTKRKREQFILPSLRFFIFSFFFFCFLSYL